MSRRGNGQLFHRRRVARLHDLQGGLCWYCGRLCAIQAPGVSAQIAHLATLEHLRGGGTVMACYECNHAKGSWSDRLSKEQARPVIRLR